MLSNRFNFPNHIPVYTDYAHDLRLIPLSISQHDIVVRSLPVVFLLPVRWISSNKPHRLTLIMTRVGGGEEVKAKRGRPMMPVTVSTANGEVGYLA